MNNKVFTQFSAAPNTFGSVQILIIVSFIPFKCPIIPSKFVFPKLMSNPLLNILANSFTLSIKPSNADVSSVIVLDTSNVSFIPAELPPAPPLDPPPEADVSF